MWNNTHTASSKSKVKVCYLFRKGSDTMEQRVNTVSKIYVTCAGERRVGNLDYSYSEAGVEGIYPSMALQS